MSRSEEHPDELIDRERKGLLRPGERDLLDAHLAECATCAIERQLSRHLALEPKRPVDPAVVERVVSGAMAAMPERSPHAQRTARVTTIGLAFAAALISALAIAAMASRIEEQGDERASLDLHDPAVPLPGSAVPVEEESPAETNSEPVTPDSPTAALPTVEAPAETLPALPIKKNAMAPRAAIPNGPGSAQTKPLEQEPMAPSAAELFARANEARRHRVGDAIALYRELSERFPTSREAMTSRVAYGRLLLDSGRDAREALGSFDAYLAAAPRGMLVEEALVGRALSYERLSDFAGEQKAWRALLEKRPGSVHADHARARLQALGD